MEGEQRISVEEALEAGRVLAEALALEGVRLSLQTFSLVVVPGEHLCHVLLWHSEGFQTESSLEPWEVEGVVP